MLDKLRFDGAPVLITGAGTGIGKACCLSFAELGASVILAGRDEAPLNARFCPSFPRRPRKFSLRFQCSLKTFIIKQHALIPFAPSRCLR